MKVLNNLILGTAVLTVGALVALPVDVSASNNGTLKVHEKGTTVASRNNDPKVCEFNFEGFGFDKGQSGVIVITTQGGGNDKAEVKRVNLPAANANGYTETEYMRIADGHYKTTLYGKDNSGNVNYNLDLKAKSKVFKVVCDSTSTPGVDGSTNNGGKVLSDAASTVKNTAELPEQIAATGGNPLQALFNTLFAGAGVYTAMLRRK